MSTFDPVVCTFSRDSAELSCRERDKNADDCARPSRSSSMAKATYWVVWQVSLPSSCSMARRSWWSAARRSTSPANSSAQNVRYTLAQDRICWLQEAPIPRLPVSEASKLTWRRPLVKYLAYLRKMTRYNPTRGGTFHNL